jgi:LysR family transcriptional regulator, transcriptional activator of the cysJI operon
MEIRQLRTFVAVAELRHFARAAALCNLSQPAVSHQIAQLEDELGARLLNRTARRVSLTVAGDVFLEEARRILGVVDRAHERMQEVARGAIGRIRLGATPTPGLYVMPTLLAEYGARHASYDLSLHISPAHVLAERVAANDLDMAVIAGPLAAGELRARQLLSDDFVVIGQAAHALARTSGIRPRELEADRWVLREEGSDTRRQLTAWWHRHRIAPARTTTFAGPDAVNRAVSAGLGVAMVSRRTIADDPAHDGITILSMGAALPVREIVLVDHPQKHHGAACRAMLALLDQTFAPVTREARSPARRGKLGARGATRRRG